MSCPFYDSLYTSTSANSSDTVEEIDILGFSGFWMLGVFLNVSFLISSLEKVMQLLFWFG